MAGWCMAKAYSQDLRERLEAAWARLLYLSPYFPDFNPVELAWSKLKTPLCKVSAHPTETLDRAIGDGLRAVSTTDAHGYFAHCGYQ